MTLLCTSSSQTSPPRELNPSSDALETDPLSLRINEADPYVASAALPVFYFPRGPESLLVVPSPFEVLNSPPRDRCLLGSPLFPDVSLRYAR